uniref:MADF domain-containing protein n=1 Tax=Panagrolaimus sp. JU765 TaxID=591449 RepID=A0AC34QHZ1_9BILA
MDDDPLGKSPLPGDDSHRPMTFNELLIQQVRAHPELYDQQHRVCTDNGERNLIWEAIASRIDDTVSGEFAKKRWLQMRDRYRKELKSALRSGIIPKWPYFEKLSWLDPYLKDNKPGSISSTFIGQNFEIGEDEETISDQPTSELMDFSSYAGLSANALLENIMAVSGPFNHHHQLSDIKTSSVNLPGEFSPDSAVASTSEDGDNRVPSANADRPDSNDGTTNEHNSLFSAYPTAAAGLLMKLEAINAAAQAAATGEQKTPLDQKLLSAFRHSNSSSPPTRPNRIRNPPYLVRRGGGLKVKPVTSKKPESSLFTSCPSPRTVSESSDSSRKQEKPRDAILEEFSGKEWANDEDMLFARLVVVRLKKFAAKERRGIRARISELIDEKEEEAEGCIKRSPIK